MRPDERALHTCPDLWRDDVYRGLGTEQLNRTAREGGRGLGQAAVTAGLGGDAALLVGIALFSAAFVFTGNLIASTLYGVVDPRMRKGAAHG